MWPGPVFQFYGVCGIATAKAVAQQSVIDLHRSLVSAILTYAYAQCYT